jgi:hypothetical protein
MPFSTTFCLLFTAALHPLWGAAHLEQATAHGSAAQGGWLAGWLAGWLGAEHLLLVCTVEAPGECVTLPSNRMLPMRVFVATHSNCIAVTALFAACCPQLSLFNVAVPLHVSHQPVRNSHQRHWQ